MAGRAQKIFGTILVAVIAALYQLYGKQYLALTGTFPRRVVGSIGSSKCEPIKGIAACEKLVLHQPTGVLFMSCSFPNKRRLWTPSLGRLDPEGYGADYMASYNPKTKQVIRMKFADLEPKRLSAHGFDVQTSTTNSSELYFYIIHHRVPGERVISERLKLSGKPELSREEKRDWRLLDGKVKEVGAESVVQVFKGTSIQGKKGSSRLTFQREFTSELMSTPNDVVGSSDGKSFYWTNDHGEAVGKWRDYELPLRLARTSVGYCHVSTGCKIAADNIISANGITSNGNGSVYVASMAGEIHVYETQKDGGLVAGDKIDVAMPLDNIAISADGALYAGGYPKIQDALKYFDDPNIKAASSGLKITKNGGKDSFFGKKYQVETVFEDNGTKTGPASSVVVDSKRKLMYLHGLTSPHLLVCKL